MVSFMNEFQKGLAVGEAAHSKAALEERKKSDQVARDRQDAERLKEYILNKLGAGYVAERSEWNAFVDVGHRWSIQFSGTSYASFGSWSHFCVSSHSGRIAAFQSGDNQTEELKRFCGVDLFIDGNLDELLGVYAGMTRSTVQNYLSEFEKHQAEDRRKEVLTLIKNWWWTLPLGLIALSLLT